jgi:hypothetical protein
LGGSDEPAGPPHEGPSSGHDPGDGFQDTSSPWDRNILSDEKRDEILAMDKGNRPDPSEYLPSEFIDHHLEKFDEGASRFTTSEALEDYGIGHRDGTTFVFPTRELDTLMQSTGGDRRALEEALGLPEGFFDTEGLVRVDIPDPGEYALRVPSGNEAGASDQWLPGGFLPTGTSEAIIDGVAVPPEDLTITGMD